MTNKKSAEYALVSKEEKPAQLRSMDDFTHMKRYCHLILLFSEFILLSGAGNMVYMVFAGAAPKSVSCIGSNTTIENVCSGALYYKEMIDCQLEVNHEFKSVNVEFEYFCRDTDWVKSSISVQMTGVLFGTLLFGSLSDRIGRKKVLAFSFVMTSLMSALCCFSTSLLSFTIIRTILGFFNGGLLGTYGVYKMEHIPKRHRFWVATVIAWAPNFILINGIAYLSHDWKTFQWTILVISSPALLLFFFIRESPRWLIQRGRINEAREVMEYIQKIDRETPYKKEEMKKMLDAEYEKHLAREGKLKNYNIRHLFYNKEMSIATVVLCVGVFFTSISNYGLVFNIEKLSGSLFLNSIIVGTLRWALNIITGILDYKCHSVGRKVVHFVSQAAIAVCVLSIAAVIAFDLDSHAGAVIRIATIIAAATSSQIFITKSIVCMEFYPTVVRNSAMAFKSTCSRIGTIVAPQLFILSPWKLLPYLLLSIMSLWDTVAFQAFLPETKGRPLPENLPQKNRKKSQPEELILVKA